MTISAQCCSMRRIAVSMFSGWRAALAWAESLTLISEAHAPDAICSAASKQFNEKELGDLTVAIGLMNTYNRIVVGFRKPPDMK